MQTLTISKPDDWHCHLRDGDFLPQTVNATARQFARAIVMPNLVPPVTTSEALAAYHARIMACLAQKNNFSPLMTLYLTDNINAEHVRTCYQEGLAYAAKLYPAGATTNSDRGVTDLQKIDEVLAVMQDIGMPLLIHGEVTNHDIDVFEREARFISDKLVPLIQRFPKLKLVLEHITTQDAVDFVKAMPVHVGATITVHHLLFNRNALLVGGIHPHYYCLPILKHRKHQQAIIDAAISGNQTFFLGTDSAPHTRGKKESACGCAGIYSAPAAIELYAEVFEAYGALDKLEAFASFYGADFYGLPRNAEKITLVKEAWQMPEIIKFGEDVVVPLRAGESVQWRLRG